MRVAAIQPSFIPWRGYFDIIASVDLFVLLDDVQFTKRDWRNRNKIKTPNGTEWLTVPVVYNSRSQLILDTSIDYSQPWGKQFHATWRANYSRAPFFAQLSPLISDVGNGEDATISELDSKLTKRVCSYLGISTPMLFSSGLEIEGTKTDRLINLLRKLKATTYLSGPSADAYLDKDAFRRHGIGLEYKSYDYPPYSQQWGTFDGAVTVLDLIANCGASARNYLRSLKPNIQAV